MVDTLSHADMGVSRMGVSRSPHDTRAVFGAMKARHSALMQWLFCHQLAPALVMSDYPQAQEAQAHNAARQAVRTWLQQEVTFRPRLAVMRRACWALVGGDPNKDTGLDCIEADKLRQLMAGTAEAPFTEAEAATMISCEERCLYMCLMR